MTKKFWILALSLVAALCLCFGLTACGEETPKTPSGTTETNPSGTLQEFTVTYDANGGAFADGGDTSSQVVKEGVKLTAPTSPTRSNYTFAGWAKSKNGSTMWKFDEDTVSGNTTLYAQWTQESAVILSVEGASIEDREIFMLVDRSTGSVSLSGKIVCSDDSIWRLYSDPEGQREIPTKMVTNLSNGNNTYYIVVNSQNQAQVNVYELTVHRSYRVLVSYYNGESLLKTEETYTGDKFTANYKPDITGYTFNKWKTFSGKEFTADVLWSATSLYADKTANTYKATLSVNGGDALTETEKTMTYDKTYSFPVPRRTGYSFVGWYVGNTQVTNANGSSLSAWQYAGAQSVTAHWQANNYAVTLKQNDNEAGTVSGGGAHAYDSQVTITATTNKGYNFLGWYDKDDEIVSDKAQYTFKMGFAVSYTAKWDYYTLTTTRNNTSAGTLSKYYSDEKVSVGTKVALTAITNRGYTFAGWYKGDEEVSKDLTYQYTMTKEDVAFEARWSKVTLTNANTSAGSITSLDSTYKIGDKVTITATINKGYTFAGWYKGETEVSAEPSYQIIMSKENVTYEARWELVDGMEKFNFTCTPTTCTITGFKDKTATEIIIPDFVTEIWWGVFSGCSRLESITIPFVGNSKKTAENTYRDTYSFGYIFGEASYTGGTAVNQYYDNSQHVTFYIPTSLKRVTVTGDISSYAFYGCRGLESVTIGSGVTEIGSYAFYNCSGLESVIWNAANCTTAGSSYYPIFSGCTNLKTVTFGENVKIIPAYAFSGCTGLTSITIPDSVTEIADDAFQGCSGIEHITVAAENSVYRSEQDCLIETDSHTLVLGCKNSVIPDGVTSIGSYAFSGCSGLTGITIPDGVTSIGGSAFLGCRGLESVTIGSGVTSIGGYAFWGCDGLTGVYITDLAAWCKIDFSGFYDECSNPLYCAHHLYLDNAEVKELITPAEIKEIKNYAFSGCSGLESVTIGNGVTSIEDSAFRGCTGLTSVTIGNGVKTIGREAFYNCSGLTSIDIPDSVTEIGEWAFSYCSGLKSVTIGSGVTSIGGSAFYNCSGLKSVTIGSGVASIGDGAFYSCSWRTSVYYKGTPSEWSKISINYKYNSALQNATRYYFSDQTPTEEQWRTSKNWWHYDEDGETIVLWTKET